MNIFTLSHASVGQMWDKKSEKAYDVLKNHQLVAADVVELSPQLDPSGISSILSAKVTRSLLMLLNQSTSDIKNE